jgi:hypothetical protein
MISCREVQSTHPRKHAHTVFLQTTRLSLHGTYLSTNASKSLGPLGASILARALQRNSCVTLIDLRGNNIASDGVRHLLLPLASITSLRSLDLSYNSITATDACHVIQTLARAAVRAGGVGCMSLFMEGNGFTPGDVAASTVWSHDLGLPVPPVHVVKKGFGDMLMYLSGLRLDIVN